ncbi:MAG: twin-arginine translocase TatA/TatE family subunit [Solirubrobacteraceae bacterium]
MIGLENPLHLALLMMVLLLVFGAKRLPDMGRSLGSGLRGFKESVSGINPSEPPVDSPCADGDVALLRRADDPGIAGSRRE